MQNSKLMQKQLERQMKQWRKLKTYDRPQKGWIQTLRKALGMTSQQLAKRAGVHRMRIVQIEKAESNDGVTLRSLRAMANEMNCDLVYALVPRQPIEILLKQQATRLANQRLKRVSHTMALENQAISTKKIKEQAAELIKKLLSGSPKHLWED